MGKQQHRSNIGGFGSTTPELYYRLNLHHRFLDHLISELESSVLSAVLCVRAQFLLPQYLQSLSEEAWTSVKTGYKAFASLEDIDVELERWKFKFTDSTEKKGPDYCYAATKNLYPNVHAIFGVLLYYASLCSICRTKFQHFETSKDLLAFHNGF